jgi:hypothetical protein
MSSLVGLPNQSVMEHELKNVPFRIDIRDEVVLMSSSDLDVS